jgi:hypothetical protein
VTDVPPPKFFPDKATLFESSIAAELRFAGVREDVSGGVQGAKKNYAESLSRALAQRFAEALRASGFPEVLPDEKGDRHESRALGVKGPKKLDVNYSTPELGLRLDQDDWVQRSRDGAVYEELHRARQRVESRS